MTSSSDANPRLVGLNVIIVLHIVGFIMYFYGNSRDPAEAESAIMWIAAALEILLIAGLIFRVNLARQCTIVFLWVSMFFGVFGGTYFLLTGASDVPPMVKFTIVVWIVVPVVIQLWMFFYLTRPDVQVAFGASMNGEARDVGDA